MIAAPQNSHLTAPDHPGLHCHTCGYNLRGLDHANRCPECGHEIRLTLEALAARPQWIRTVSRGALFIAAAIALDSAALALTFAGWRVMPLRPMTHLLAPSLPLMHLLATLIAAAGAWFFFAPDPTTHRKQFTSTLGRVLSIASATLQCQLSLMPLNPLSRSYFIPIGPILIAPAFSIWCAQAILTYCRGVALAIRIADRSAAIQGVTLCLFALATTIAALASATPTALNRPLAIVAVALAISTAVWSSIFFCGLSITLPRRLSASR